MQENKQATIPVTDARKILRDAGTVFWDFDGVIKDSVEVKTRAYEKIFVEFGQEVGKKVRLHHQENGGVSRYEKIPYYLKHFVKKTLSQNKIENMIRTFARLVEDEVVTSPWIPGVERILRDNPFKQKFILVTGTPQDEMHTILKRLKLTQVFSSVHGAPEEKNKAVKQEIKQNSLKLTNSIFVGDSLTDYEAAYKNGIPFILRYDEETLPTGIDTVFTIHDFTGIL